MIENEDQEIVILPPYVSDEHKKLIAEAEETLKSYDKLLMDTLKSQLNLGGSPSIKAREPSVEELMMVERQFLSDPVRSNLIKRLGMVRFLCERPRFMIKKNED